MNKKILLIATLVLMTIVSLGVVSAADDAVDDSIAADAGDIVIADGEGGETPDPNVINIAAGTSAEDIQATFDDLTDNSIVNFEEGEYNLGTQGLKINKTIKTQEQELDDEGNPKVDDEGNAVMKDVYTPVTLNNIVINGNGATIIGKLPMSQNSNYFDGIFEVDNVNGLTLSGFNFIVSSAYPQVTPTTPSCLIIYNTTNAIIENNNITGGRFGLYLGSKFIDPNYDAIVRNNTIYDALDMGIISFGSPRSHIYNNTIINPANHGIDVRHGSGPNCIVENNTIIGAREGIYLMHSAGHKAIGNILSNCDVGITCYGSSNIFCDENKFTDNTKIGFLLSSGYDNIQIGENNDYSGLFSTKMPPTFAYKIVKADSAYVSATNGIFSQIVPVETAINASALTTVAKTNKNLVFTLYDSKGNPLANKIVSVTLNGKTTNVTTNADGQATIKTNFAAAGTYYYTLSFLGDDSGCKACLTTVKVTVNKQAVKATFAKKTFKVKATKKISFTLKDASGKALAGKKITFKVNKKTYTAKTNSKGIATVKIVIKKKGKYTATAKFAGDSAYKAISKKALIRVK